MKYQKPFNTIFVGVSVLRYLDGYLVKIFSHWSNIYRASQAESFIFQLGVKQPSVLYWQLEH